MIISVSSDPLILTMLVQASSNHPELIISASFDHPVCTMMIVLVSSNYPVLAMMISVLSDN